MLHAYLRSLTHAPTRAYPARHSFGEKIEFVLHIWVSWDYTQGSRSSSVLSWYPGQPRYLGKGPKPLPIDPFKGSDDATNSRPSQRPEPRFEDVLKRRLDEAKKAKERRATYAAANRARERPPVRLVLELPAETKERAERACMIETGLILSAYMRAAIKAFSDRAPDEPKVMGCGRRARSGFLPQDQEWGEMIAEYLAETGDGETSVSALFDSLEIPEEARIRSDQIAIGRIMRVLGWHRLWLWRRPKQKRGARLARIGGAPTSV